jgi:hypothetical protein
MRNPKSVEYFERWTVERFRPARLYVMGLLLSLTLSLVLSWVDVGIWNERFSFDVLLFTWGLTSGASVFLIFVIRRAMIMASWVVAKKALEIYRLGNREKVRVFLDERYRGIHPLVVRRPEIQKLLLDIGMTKVTTGEDGPFSGQQKDIEVEGYRRAFDTPEERRIREEILRKGTQVWTWIVVIIVLLDLIAFWRLFW